VRSLSAVSVGNQIADLVRLKDGTAHMTDQMQIRMFCV
jgi:hypothetical protein